MKDQNLVEGVNFLNPGEDPRLKELKKYYRVNKRTLELLIFDDKGRQRYEIDLERCCTAADFLDWIYQVKGKNWCTPLMLSAVVFGLGEALQEILDKSVQETCHYGRNQKLVW